MDLVPQFDDFVSAIRLTQKQRDNLREGHRTLKGRLLADRELAPIIVTTFLQGSYRRFTSVKPKNGQRADVDLVVVTRLSERLFTPRKAMDVFVPFLNRHYAGKWRPQGRSFGIELDYVDMDLVVTSEPASADQALLKALRSVEEWDVEEVALRKSWEGAWLVEHQDPKMKMTPLRIPDRDTNRWEDTHPLEQIRWTQEKNKRTNGLYVDVVKSSKWWKLGFPTPKHPRGYPLEHLIGDCCPDGVRTLAEGITGALEQAVVRYAPYAAAGTTPFLQDRGVPAHNVWHRITPADFGAFYARIKEGAAVARRALNATDARESGELWQRLLGSEFKLPPSERGPGAKGGFTERVAPTVIGTGGERWG